jgi:acyl carrier protein
MKNEILTILNDMRPDQNWQSSRDFIFDGLLDSLDIVVLVAALEEKFGILINGEEVKPDNFNNIESLEKFVARHLDINES